MNDPKYTPTDKGLLHEDGYLVPLDEPVMTLRAKDIGALKAIVAYIEMLESNPFTEVIESHLQSSLERLQKFYEYQIENPELQSVGCSRAAHPDGVWYLHEAREKLQQHGIEPGKEVAA